MQNRIQARLEMLRKDFERGQVELQKVESQRVYLQETILQIRGAIQVLEELMAEEQPAKLNGIAGTNEVQPAPTHANENDIQ